MCPPWYCCLRSPELYATSWLRVSRRISFGGDSWARTPASGDAYCLVTFRPRDAPEGGKAPLWTPPFQEPENQESRIRVSGNNESR